MAQDQDDYRWEGESLARDIEGSEALIGHDLERIEKFIRRTGDAEAGRWLSIARTHLETGFMFAIKAVARPTNGLGRKNPE